MDERRSISTNSQLDSALFCSISVSREERDVNGMTDLLRAASAQNWREVRKLILDGADPSVADDQGLTALHYAAFDGNKELARVLIEHRPAGLVLLEAAGGETSLFVACSKGHIEVAKILIEAGGEALEALLFKRQKNGSTCLHAACMRGHLELVKALIEAGGQALLLATQNDGGTCLHVACVHGQLEVAKALIEAGGKALVLATEINGGSCLHMACTKGHLEVAKVLIEAGGKALLLATDGAFGFSCLHAACGFGHLPLVRFLLTLPCADLVGLRDLSGRTALDLAIANHHADAAEAVRAASAQPGARARQGNRTRDGIFAATGPAVGRRAFALSTGGDDTSPSGAGGPLP
jgi:ankyrin repeat protein